MGTTSNIRFPRKRGGFSLAYLAIVTVALIAMASLAVDLGRVQVAKTQLHRLADAAALYAAHGLEAGNQVAWAQSAAAAETVDVYGPNGTPFSLLASDVVTGYWDGSTFTAGGSPTNAVQVSAACTAARGTAIPLLLAKTLGLSTCDIHAVATATYADNPWGGFVGYNGVDAKNNAFIGSYNSAVSTSPSEASSNSNGSVGSNAAIASKNNNDVYGQVLLGPSGTQKGFTVTGTTIVQPTPLVPPAVPAWSPGANPNSVPQAYTVSSDTTLPAGTYWFTSLEVDATLTFDGPATIYVNGTLNLTGTLVGADSLPTNLTIYGYGANTFNFGNANGNTAYLGASVVAPTCDFVEKNNFVYWGRGFFNTITIKNSAEFYYDEAFGAANGGKQVWLVN